MKLSFKEWLKNNEIGTTKEMVGTTAIVGSCKGGTDFNVWGACSDLKNNSKKHKKNK